MSYKNPRIDLNDNMMSAVMKLADGNPGAIRVLMELITANPTVDPDDFAGELGPLLSLDTLDVYADRIWMFYKDVCDCDIVQMLGLMRANQLGFLNESRLIRAIDDTEPLSQADIDGYLAQVKQRLPAFNEA